MGATAGKRQSCTIGVDMGTTNAKAIAFDADGREIARAQGSVTLAQGADGWVEQDPREVDAAVTAAVAEVARRVGELGYRVGQVGISAAMHSVLAVSADGTPLTNAIIWMDTRARAEAHALWRSPEGKALYGRTGTPVHAMAPLPKLLWMRKNLPQVFAQAYKFVSLKEWVWHRWFDEWVVDASIASATGLYNLREGSWDAEALTLVGIGVDRLARLEPTTYVRRGVRDTRLLDAEIGPEATFNVGASDGVLANLGMGVVDPQLMVLTIGTSLAVRAGSPAPVTDAETQLFCYVLDRDRFVLGGASNSGGIVLDWLAHKLLSDGGTSGQAEGLEAMVEAAGHVETGDLLCLPYVAGERAPLWQEDARGVLFGLELHHTRAHVVRAAVEGVILNAYWIAEGMFKELGRPRAVLATGKVLETDWIRQLTADVFGLPVEYRGAVDASALGAATLANIACGVWAWDGVMARAAGEQASIVQPSGARELYAAKLGRFQRLARALTVGELAGLYRGH